MNQHALAVPEPEPEQRLVETSAMAIAAREKAAVDARFLVAMRQPRNQDVSRQALLRTCKQPRFAEKALYILPRGKKDIVGFTIRFAEECARAFGNMDIRSVVTHEGETQRQIRVEVTDLEANVTWSADVVVNKTVERRSVKEGDEVLGKRTNSEGQPVYIIRATDDDLLQKHNQLVSKAARNLILKHIPAHILEEAREGVDEVRAAKITKDPEATRKDILDAFAKYGVSPEMVSELVGVPSTGLTTSHLVWLQSVGAALKEGEVTLDELKEYIVARKAPTTPDAQSKTQELKDRLAARKGKAPAREPGEE